MSDLVSIPVDEEAERVVVGTAIAWPGVVASDILRRVDPADFYEPAHRRLLEYVCDDLDGEPVPGETALDARVRLLAKAAGVPASYVADLAHHWAQLGQRHLAPRRVLLASRRRELMALAREAYNGAASLDVNGVSSIADRMAELRDEIAELEAAPRLVVLAGGAA